MPRMPLRDLSLLVAAVVCAAFLAFEFDFFHDQNSLSIGEKAIEVDEMMLIGSMLLVGLLILFWRRTRDHKNELARRIAAEQHAAASARHDSLTGLANRRRFTEGTRHALSQAVINNTRCAVLFIDLDRFKPVNDSYGHAAGDALLVELATRLRDTAGRTAQAARLGGDEFGVLLPFGSDDDTPELMARRIQRALEAPMQIDGRSVAVGVSIGIAIGPEASDDAEALIHAADVAMYDAKRSGRGGVRIFKAA